MVSALDSVSRGRVIVLCSWAKHFTLTMSHPTQELLPTGIVYTGGLEDAGYFFMAGAHRRGRSSIPR